MSRLLARIGLSLPVIVATVLLLFAVGTWIGGRFLVPEGQGLAGPVEAMSYGVLAALIGLAVSIVAAVRLSLKSLLVCALASLAIIAGMAVLVSLAARAVDEAQQDLADQPQIRAAPTEPVPSGEDEGA